MSRVLAIGGGGILVALGVAWFFTSLVDGLLLSLAGPMVTAPVTPISKMLLSDSISLLLAGLTLIGAGLMALGLFTSLPRQG
jgi:hypothetical protein